MSVALTTDAVRERRKTVTRRMGWEYAKPGDQIQLCEKVMGRRAGQPLVRIALVELTDVSRVRLDTIPPEECALEGLWHMSPDEFVAMFCATHKGATPDGLVTRLAWKYLPCPKCNDTGSYLQPVNLPGFLMPGQDQTVEAIAPCYACDRWVKRGGAR